MRNSFPFILGFCGEHRRPVAGALYSAAMANTAGQCGTDLTLERICPEKATWAQVDGAACGVGRNSSIRACHWPAVSPITDE